MASDNTKPVALAVDKLKGLAKSTQHFTNGILDNFGFSKGRRPIEILKRLQREAFSDIMKLRDRQDKVERLLSLKSSKSSPFYEGSTRVRGEIEALGLLLMIDKIGKGTKEVIDRMGIETGVNSRLTFETTVREKDLFTAEFVAKGSLDGPLSLAKVIYSANVNDWCSLIAVPLGAKCGDVSLTSSNSCTGPPLLSQHIGSGIGLTVKNSNCVASLTQFATQPESESSTNWLSTFGQLSCQLSLSTKVSLLGLNKIPNFPKLPIPDVSLGPMTLPIGSFGHYKELMEAGYGSIRYTALVLESDLDSSTKVGGWVEMNTIDSRSLQWGTSVSHLPEDDIGLGIRVGCSNAWDMIEAFSRVKFGEKFLLQPSLMLHVKDGSARFPALAMKSTWSF